MRATMTEYEIQIEKEYRIQERLGILTQGDRNPTLPEQFQANEEANEWERQYRAESYGV